MVGKPRELFRARAGIVARTGTTRSRWDPQPRRNSAVPPKLANFCKLSQEKREQKLVMNQRRSLGLCPYTVTATRTGGLLPFADAPSLLPSSQPLTVPNLTVPNSIVNVAIFPACHIAAPGAVLDPGPGFTVLSLDDHGRLVTGADVIVVNSFAELDDDSVSKLVRNLATSVRQRQCGRTSSCWHRASLA